MLHVPRKPNTYGIVMYFAHAEVLSFLSLSRQKRESLCHRVKSVGKVIETWYWWRGFVSVLIWMTGIGYASVVIVQFLNIYYIVILGWALFYMFASFTSKLPWSHCDNPWNTPQCVDLTGTARPSSSGNGQNGSGMGILNDTINGTVSPLLEKVSASQEYLEYVNTSQFPNILSIT